ncbi:hypothetical protein [Streptomyces xanthophaeus]|uniref:hypothetical protein n=1 Tax=Streptomyces xanthophaeus TaxID=67385 RepID=UPI00366909CC
MSKRACIATLAATLTLTLASLCGASPATARALPNTCGGALSDYTGLAGTTPVPFTGTLTVAVKGQPVYSYPITITSEAPNSNLLRVNAKLPNGEEVATVSGLTLEVDSLGRGNIRFQSPTGLAHTEGVACAGTGLLAPSTRVTKMMGKMTDPTKANQAVGDFSVSRPTL